ncbi:MFS transporter [Candidatus Bipolaricaulota bacterium]|nr:MFS transporter [Candidatus Bipolaricaulota bacterium]
MWKTFASLFIAVAVAMLGIGIISPILPLYVETFSASGLVIGIIMGAFSLSRGLLGPFVGRLSDRIGRKRFLLAGLGIFALVSLCYSLAGNVWQLILVRIIQGAASVMVTPIAQGYVGDITPVGKEGRMMNLFYSSMFIGVGLGPLLGGVLTDLWSYHAAFAGMGILSALSLLLIAVTLPADHDQAKKLPEEQRLRSIIPLRQIAKNDAVKAILAYVATRGFWRQGFNTFYPLFAVSMLGWSASDVGYIMSGYFIAGGLFQIPFGFLADRWPRNPQIILGSFAAPLMLLLIPFMRSFVGVMAVVFSIGMLSAFSRASILAIRTELGRTHGMATLAGLHGSAFASGQMIGPVVCGAVVDVFGLSAVFPFGSLIGGLGSFAVILWLRRAARSERDLATSS